MHAKSHLQVLNNATDMQMVITKLPIYLQNKWRNFAAFYYKYDAELTFATFAQFVENAADAANHPVYSREALNTVGRSTISTVTQKSKAASP